MTSTGTTITSYVDRWDGAGNRLSRIEQDGTRVTWSYDATYQLINEQRSGANSYNTTYAYDPAGNRRLKLDNAVRTTYSNDAANQLQKYLDNTGTTTFTFDASGNQRMQQTPSSGTTTNTWDFENRLTKVALPSGVLNTFTYNGDNLRVQRQDSSGTLKQIWDDLRILEDTDQNNIVQAVYTLSRALYGDVVSQRRSGVGGYYLFDPLGSTIRLTNGSQSPTDTYLYKAFGDVVLAGPSSNAFRYGGRQQYYFDSDASVYHVRARHLDPLLGRFRSRDPLGIAVDPNFYRLVSNSPVNTTDPSGFGGVFCEVGLPIIPLVVSQAFPSVTAGFGCYNFKAKIQCKFTGAPFFLDLVPGGCNLAKGFLFANAGPIDFLVSLPVTCGAGEDCPAGMHCLQLSQFNAAYVFSGNVFVPLNALFAFFGVAIDASNCKMWQPITCNISASGSAGFCLPNAAPPPGQPGIIDPFK